MTTWGTLLADLRTDLRDAGTTQRYTDAMLFLWTKDAIRDYSQYLPLRETRVALTLSGEGYPLPTNFRRDVLVECPRNSFLERRRERPGTRFTSNGTPLRYWIDGATLYLNSETDDQPLLTYDAVHDLPAAEDDTNAVLSLPDDDEEVIRLYVKAKAVEYVRTRQANLDRYKPGSGDRDDNPLIPEYEQLMRAYRIKISERTRGGTIYLYRPGRIS